MSEAPDAREQGECDGAEACEGTCDQHTPEDFQMLELLDEYAECKAWYEMEMDQGHGPGPRRAEKDWDAVRIKMSAFLDSVTITKKEE